MVLALVRQAREKKKKRKREADPRGDGREEHGQP